MLCGAGETEVPESVPATPGLGTPLDDELHAAVQPATKSGSARANQRTKKRQLITIGPYRRAKKSKSQQLQFTRDSYEVQREFMLRPHRQQVGHPENTRARYRSLNQNGLRSC
jgi:hypothetical protein